MSGRDKDGEIIVKRFTPVKVYKPGGFQDADTWSVKYYDEEWSMRSVDVSATDELHAFVVAKHILQHKKNKEFWGSPRVFFGGLVLAVFTVSAAIALILS